VARWLPRMAQVGVTVPRPPPFPGHRPELPV
jgi:hypothetical protein